MKIYFDVKNQIITRTDRNQVIANSADYLEAEITFSAEWATMEKTMTFKNGNLLYTYVLVNDKILEENHLNLGVGTWKVSIQGVNEDKKIVTNECNLAVNASGWIGSEALPPESIWNQLLVIIQSLHTEVASTAALRSAVQKYIEDNYDALVKEAVIVDDVRAALDDMAEDGTLSDLLAPLVAAGMPEVVADQISAVVAAQIGGVVANQIGAVVASQITTPVNQAVKNYCDDNFSGWSGALDRGLTQPLMAAPADMVGAIKSALSEVDNDLESATYSITDITTINGLVFVPNDEAFDSNGQYRCITFPVRRRRTYTFDVSSTNPASNYHLVYSSDYPEDGVSATLFKHIQPSGAFTESIVYHAEHDGYVTLSFYKAGGEDGSVANIIATSVGIDNRLTNVENELRGTSSIIVPTLADRIDFVVATSKFTSSNSYHTKYFQTVKGKHYRVKIKSTNSPSSYRIATSSSAPANDVVGSLVSIVYATPSTTFEYNFNYDASSNGYLAVATYRYAFDIEVYDITEGEYEKVDSYIANDSILSSAFSMLLNQNHIQKLWIEREALTTKNNQNPVSMEQWTQVPHFVSKVYLKCPSNIIVKFTLRPSPQSSSGTITTQYYGNGDSITFSGYNVYRMTISKGKKEGASWVETNNLITVDELADLIESDLFALYYVDTDIVVNNTDIEKDIRALIADKPLLAHISDTHGDAVRYRNFFEMCEHMDALCAINTGDVVANSNNDGMGYLETEIRKHPNMTTLFCIGNHDHLSTNAEAYNRYYKMYDDAYSYELSADKTYYYKDFATQKLRFIVLNIYEERCNGFNCRISKDQIDWFIATLASTPADYGVFVLAHSSEKVIYKDDAYPKFFSKDITIDWGCVYSGITGNPVSTIIDAFISKTSVSGSYTQRVKESVESETLEDETVNYSADFTSVPSSAEFIAYVNGHKHKDMVGYFHDTNNLQLSLNITHGVTGAFYEDQDDFPRGKGKGSTQDAFNLYAVDRTNKAIIVMRVGANKTFDFTDRNWMSIPYAE